MDKRFVGRWYIERAIFERKSEKDDEGYISVKIISVEEYLADGSLNLEAKVRLVVKNSFNYIECLADLFAQVEWKVLDDYLYHKVLSWDLKPDSLSIDEEIIDGEQKKIFFEEMGETFNFSKKDNYEIIFCSEDRIVLIEKNSSGDEMPYMMNKTKKLLSGYKIDI